MFQLGRSALPAKDDMVRRPQGHATDVRRFKGYALRAPQPAPMAGEASALQSGWRRPMLDAGPPPRDRPWALAGLVAHG